MIVHPLLVYPLILSGVSVALIHFLVSTSFVSLLNSVADSRGSHLHRAITDLDQCSHMYTHTPLSLQKPHACQLPFLSKISLILQCCQSSSQISVLFTEYISLNL